MALSFVPTALLDYPLGAWDRVFGGKEAVQEPRIHLGAAMAWLCRAQDATPDRGLARMYHLRTGWGASYPETTGYAIPTFIDYGKMVGSEEFIARARQMAEWECAVQMPSGAVQGGVITDAPTPAIFNTGQVIFGWCAAYRETKIAQFAESAMRAARYLCKMQDDDGAWRRELSKFCSAPSDSYSYNARSAWALMVAHQHLHEPAFKAAAEANAAYVLTKAHDNGWVEDNCLTSPAEPLLHTIAYTYQGMLELAALTGNSGALDLVVRGNTALRSSFHQRGRLLGRYDQSWSPTVSWRCLTGEAQTAVVWFRLAEILRQDEWASAASALLRQVKMTQLLHGRDEVRGGIKGSHPIDGPYGRFQYLNWAAKFFADAVMLEIGIADASTSG